jgi:hypothetical protein
MLTKLKAMLVKLWAHLMHPPPSNLIFYTLIITTFYLLWQVEMQGRLINTQYDLIEWLVTHGIFIVRTPPR